MGKEVLRQTRPRRSASIDRAGHAVIGGGAVAGVIAVVLLALGGQRDPLWLAIGWIAASGIAALAIVAVGGPLWLLLRRLGWHGPVGAAAAGFTATLLLCLSAQTRGFGILSSATADPAALTYRWASAAATSLILGLAGGGIAALMWWIAHRRAR